MKLKVEVVEKSGEKKAISHPIEFRIMPYFLRRVVRKGTNYVEDSFTAETKDAKVRVKPFLVTRRKVPRKVRKALRKKAKEELVKYLKKKSSEEVFDDLLKNNLQKPLSLKLKKIYPLTFCEIRVLKVEEKLEKTQEKQPGTKKETSKEGN